MNRTTGPRVVLWQGKSRAENVRLALERVINEIDWSTRKSVVVKPNLVTANYPLAITHRETLQAVLALIRQRYDGPLSVAEGCATHGTFELFDTQDYRSLVDSYRAQLIDLNADAVVPVQVRTRDGKPLHLRLSRTIYESDCRISLTLPKTHDTVLVTLTLKNMIMGALVNRRNAEGDKRAAWHDILGRRVHGNGNGWGSDKLAMHQSYPVMNLNLALLAPLVRPDLAIVDGFIAMEGAGPIHGSPVPWGIVVAGTDPLAVDVLTAHLMGFEIDEIGYLKYCGELGLGEARLDCIHIDGNVTPDAVTRCFIPHPQHLSQRQWQLPGADQWLRAPASVEKT